MEDLVRWAPMGYLPSVCRSTSNRVAEGFGEFRFRGDEAEGVGSQTLSHERSRLRRQAGEGPNTSSRVPPSVHCFDLTVRFRILMSMLPRVVAVTGPKIHMIPATQASRFCAACI